MKSTIICMYWLTRQDVAKRIVLSCFVGTVVGFATAGPVPQVTYNRQQPQSVFSFIFSSEIPEKKNSFFTFILF